MAEIKRIECGKRMSAGVSYNGILWLAGQVGDPAKDVTGQTRDCLAEVDRLLAVAGTDKTRILSAQIWLADMGDFAAHVEFTDSIWVMLGSPFISVNSRRGIISVGAACLLW